jgi:hypothetical protein
MLMWSQLRTILASLFVKGSFFCQLVTVQQFKCECKSAVERRGKGKTGKEIKVMLKEIKTMSDLHSMLQLRAPEQNMSTLGQ